MVKKGLYPLWVEVVHRAASRAIMAWNNYHLPPIPSSTSSTPPLLFDFAELLTDENQRFETIYRKLDQRIFTEGTSLRRGQPLILLYSELQKLRETLRDSIAHDRKQLLRMVNPPTVKNIWRKPIDYRELLLSFFTCAYTGIMADLQMHREQTLALQSALVRQITREIRLDSLNKMIRKLDEISRSGLVDMRALEEIKGFLGSHFNHVRMPGIQRELLCYEWLTGAILQPEEVEGAKVIVADKKKFERVVRKVLVKC